ncbi:hypothetical protein [Yoonia sp. MH D7]
MRLEAETARLAGISLIAVPWRKFYRTEFLRHHRIRFPEGDFFFEDNPFHWEVCTLAETISFSRHITCHHRVNRPGQTMASTGVELAAFFSHFHTIQDGIPEGRDDLRIQAVRWLIENMDWHIPRLQQSAFCLYATRAYEALQQIGNADWEILAGEISSTMTWHYADRLRKGGIWDVVEAWQKNVDRAVQSQADSDILDLGKRLQDMEHQLKAALEILQAQRAIDEFATLKELLNPKRINER